MKSLRRVLRFLFSRIPEQTRRFIKLHLLPSGLVPYVAAAIANETPKKRLSSRYSLVVSCYNVEPYIDEFFGSLLAQTVDLKRLEIIAVDDGSTDGTAARIADWAERLPIRHVPAAQSANRGRLPQGSGLLLPKTSQRRLDTRSLSNDAGMVSPQPSSWFPRHFTSCQGSHR